MAYDATRICNNILSRAFRDGDDVTPMKLQKILYFVASEYAKQTGRPLLSEPFQAWQYGPVVASVYSEFKPFGSKAIRRFAKDATGRAYVIDEDRNEDLRVALDRVWPATRSRAAAPLSRVTHSVGSAWHKAWVNSYSYITDDDIKADNTYRTKLGIDD